MADIVGLDGKPIGGPPTSNPNRKAHTYRIRSRNHDTVEIEGVLFITPVFVAIGNEETGEFSYIVPFDHVADIINLDGTEAQSAA